MVTLNCILTTFVRTSAFRSCASKANSAHQIKKIACHSLHREPPVLQPYQLHRCLYACLQTSWAWAKDTATPTPHCTQDCEARRTNAPPLVEDARMRHQTREWTDVTGQADACAYLWHFITWRFLCMELAAFSVWFILSPFGCSVTGCLTSVYLWIFWFSSCYY